MSRDEVSIPFRKQRSNMTFLEEIYTELNPGRGQNEHKTKITFLYNKARLFENITQKFHISTEIVLSESKINAYQLNDFIISEVFNALICYKRFEKLVNEKMKSVYEFIPAHWEYFASALKKEIFYAGENFYEYIMEKKYQSREEIYNAEKHSYDDLKKLFKNFKNAKIIINGRETKEFEEGEEEFFEELDILLNNRVADHMVGAKEEAEIIVDDKKYELSADKVIYDLVEKKTGYFEKLKNLLNTMKDKKIRIDSSIFEDLADIEENVEKIAGLQIKKGDILQENIKYIQQNQTDYSSFNEYLKKTIKNKSFSLKENVVSEILFKELRSVISFLYGNLSDISKIKPCLIDYKTINTELFNLGEKITEKKKSKPSIIRFNNNEQFKINGKAVYQYFIDTFIDNLIASIGTNNLKKDTKNFKKMYLEQSEQWNTLVDWSIPQIITDNFTHINLVQIAILQTLQSIHEAISESKNLENEEYNAIINRIKHLKEINERIETTNSFNEDYPSADVYIKKERERRLKAAKEKEAKKREETKNNKPEKDIGGSSSLLFRRPRRSRSEERERKTSIKPTENKRSNSFGNKK